MGNGENEAIVRAYIEQAWNENSATAIQDFVHPEFVGFGPGPFRRHGQKSVSFFHQLLWDLRRFRDMRSRWVIEEMIVSGDTVVTRIALESQPQAWDALILEFSRSRVRSEEETGIDVSSDGRLQAVTIHEIKDGRIWRERLLQDSPAGSRVGAHPDEERRLHRA